MKILFLTLSFSQGDRISFYEELLQEFIRNGHEIFVACALERKFNEYTYFKQIRGMNVLGIRTGNITGNISLLEKGFSTLLIDYCFKKNIKKYFFNIPFDFVLYPTPPITLVKTVSWLKNNKKVSTYLLLKDIFPQNAVDLKILSKYGIKSFLYNYFRRKEKKLYSISDFIGCMSPANVEYILKNNPEISKDKIEVCPNCIKIEEQKSYDISLRNKFNIPQDKTVFVYGGNLGKPQGIDFIKQCLLKCKNLNSVFFVIAGGGAATKNLKDFIRQYKLQNIKFIDMLPKNIYKEVVRVCDVGLIFLDSRFTIPNFPSRLLSYMQASLPVLAATDKNTDIGSIITNNGFGWWCESVEVNDFYKCIKEVINSNLKEMGVKSFSYLKNNYTVEICYKIIMKHFISIK